MEKHIAIVFLFLFFLNPNITQPYCELHKQPMTVRVAVSLCEPITCWISAKQHTQASRLARSDNVLPGTLSVRKLEISTVAPEAGEHRISLNSHRPDSRTNGTPYKQRESAFVRQEVAMTGRTTGDFLLVQILVHFSFSDEDFCFCTCLKQFLLHTLKHDKWFSFSCNMSIINWYM